MAADNGAKRKDVEELFETTPVEDIRVILTGINIPLTFGMRNYLNWGLD